MNVKYHPIQKLCYVSQAGGVDFLLTAVGPHIVSLGLENGGVLSKWPDHTHKTSQTGVGDESGNRDLDDESREDDPPSKRRKLDSTEENTEEQDSGESSGSIEFASERTKGQRRKKKKIVVTPLPNVSHLICTIDGRYVIAATAEDKCIRVFEIDSGGRLKPLSERQAKPYIDRCELCLLICRCMPKRLCAIALTRNQSIILAGDKFGDVYALPLKPSSLSDPVSQSKPKLEVPKSFKPSASELTVHTKGNREALRQQQLQKASAAKKQEPTFEHQLILGHVSLLTDLVVGIDAASPAREYILTADRDEHIRVSRGVPQAHVINNYCLGHTAFVSKLCLVPEKPQLLISAGGEPALRIYDWLQGTMLAEISLEEGLRQLFGSQPYEKRSVSCLRALYIGSNHSREDVIMIMVVMEG